MTKFLPQSTRLLFFFFLCQTWSTLLPAQLACNDLVNITLDLNCSAEVLPDMILEGGSPVDNMTHDVELYFDRNLTRLVPGSPFLDGTTVGQRLYAKVIHRATQNFCWGEILPEDKDIPDLSCTTRSATCADDTSPEALGFPVGAGVNVFQTPAQQGTNAYTLTGFDPCGEAILTFSDRRQINRCNATREVITRTWTVRDESQNSTSCIETINLRRVTFADLVLPPDLDGVAAPALQCDERCPDQLPACGTTTLGWNVLPPGHPFAGHPSPYDDFYDCGNGIVRCQGTGVPTGIDCGEFNVVFNDTRINQCASGPSESCYKIIRRWTITDWCTNDVRNFNQVIKVEDDEAPVINGVSDLTISVDVWRCAADWYGTEPWLTDNCDAQPLTYSVSSTVGQVEYLPAGRFVIRDLPIGVHQVTYTAADCCGNTRDSVINLTVLDDVPPVATCDARTVVSITTTPDPLDQNLGTTKIFALSLDDGSYDACGNDVFFKILRMDEYDSNGNGKTPERVRDGDWQAIDCNAVNGDDDLRTRPSEFRGPQAYFDDYAKFCCEDTGDTIMVVFRVFDIDPEPYTFGKAFPSLVPPGENPDDYNGVVPEFMEFGGPLYGRYNDCMVEVIVQDKLGPRVVAPPNITVSCDYWFPFDANNPQDYTDEFDEIFGKVVAQSGTQSEDRDSILIRDRVCPGHPRVPQFGPSDPADDPCYDDKYDIYWGMDGFATDNCGVEIEQTIIPDLECGRGDIIRRWTANDFSGNHSNTATQRITIISCKDFFVPSVCWRFTQGDIGDCLRFGQTFKSALIEWPCDIEINRCQSTGTDAFLPDNLPIPFEQDRRPRVDDDNCSLIGITYEDRSFIFVDSACVKIFRDWQVIDWCLYEDFQRGTYTGEYEFFFTQVIKLLNTEGPTFAECTDQTFCGFGDPNNPNADQCVGEIVLEPSITDDCSPIDVIRTDYKIDAFNDGSYDILGYSDNHPVSPFPGQTARVYPSATPNANGQYPVGVHRILWSAEDGCGNRTSCEYLFTVEDCKAPTPYCRVGVSTIPMVMQGLGVVEIWASDYDIGSTDNCTESEDLIYSFSDDPTDLVRSFTCADAPGLFNLTVYVWDLDLNGQPRNFATCGVTIQLTDCDMQTTYQVAGVMQTEAGVAVDQVNVKVDGDYQVEHAFDGNYRYFLPRHNNYSIAPGKNKDFRNGVSTFDLVLMSKHITGQQALGSPYKIIAADVNNSGSVTTFDLIELRKLILYINREFPEVPSWRFIAADFDFIDPSNPFATQFPEVYSVNGLATDMEIDFVGVKMGDVNESARANAQVPRADTRSAETLYFTTTDRQLLSGELTQIDFRASDLPGKLGYQFALRYEEEQLEVLEIIPGALNGLDLANFGQQKGLITTSWHADQGADLAQDAVVFSLLVKAKKPVQLSEALSIQPDQLAAEAYTAELVSTRLGLQFAVEQPLANDDVLFQNQPNPFLSQTTIGFQLSEPGKATLHIYDVTGKVLKVIEGDYSAGYQEVIITANELSTTGILYYSLETARQTLTKRMVFVK